MGAHYKDVFSVTRGKIIASAKIGWVCVQIILIQIMINSETE